MRRLQEVLARRTGRNIEADGIYGPATAAAVRVVCGSSVVDEDCWLRLFDISRIQTPSYLERCLQVTADLEGHGFTKAVGNFDGAGLTWGIIGFNLKSGSLQEVLRRVPRETLEEHLTKSQLAKLLTSNVFAQFPRQVSPELERGLDRLGRSPGGVAAQMGVAEERYWVPACEQARKLRLRRILDFGLLFDIHVQNGPLPSKVLTEASKLEPIGHRRSYVVNYVAEKSAARWRVDVLLRKQLFVAGYGLVHRRWYDLRKWGF